MIKRFVLKRLLRTLLCLQPWDVEYFRHLLAEWDGLSVDPDSADGRLISKLSAKFDETPSTLHRGHLLEFEQALLRQKTPAALLQLAPSIRLRYHDVVGDRQFATYKESQVPSCTPIDAAAKELLVADLSVLVDSIHWRYVLAPFRDKVRTSLTISALIWVGIYTVIWLGVVFAVGHYFHNIFVAVFVTVLYAGILGGFISALRRMQSINDDTDSVFVIQGIAGADFWLWFSPMLGGVFAVVAYVFFLSGLVGAGTVFPAFRQVDHPLWLAVVPKLPQDYAKLFLWSFIAGFAERFIPDMIDRIIQRAQGTSSNAPPNTRLSAWTSLTTVIPSVASTGKAAVNHNST